MTDRQGTADERTPKHYRGEHKLQPWDVIDAFGLDFYTGNAIKYICRYGTLADTGDLVKAHHYLEKAMQNAGLPRLYSDANPVDIAKDGPR